MAHHTPSKAQISHLLGIGLALAHHLPGVVVVADLIPLLQQHAA